MTIENVIPVKNCSEKTICLSVIESTLGISKERTIELKPSQEEYIDFADKLTIEITIKNAVETR